MKRVVGLIFFVASAVFLVGCASMSMKAIDGPVKKAAVAFEFDSNRLCHNYRGLMVFDNFQKVYDLPKHFESEFKFRILEVFARYGVDVEVIEPGSISPSGHRFLQHSDWDNTAKIAPVHLEKFRQMMMERGVDTAFVTTPWPKSNPDHACHSILDYSPRSESGFGSGTQLLRVFTADGARIGELYTYVRKENIPSPEDPEVLTDEFLNLVMERVLQQAESEVDGYLAGRNGQP